MSLRALHLGNRAHWAPPAHLLFLWVIWVTNVQLVTYWYPLDRDCAECKAFGTGPLATNCSTACAHANMTLVLTPTLDDSWCKERTQDNQLFFFLAEDEAGGRVVLTVSPPESK